MTCEPAPSCHRCPAGVQEFLRTDLPAAPKSMRLRREEITAAATGDALRESGMRAVRIPLYIVHHFGLASHSSGQE